MRKLMTVLCLGTSLAVVACSPYRVTQSNDSKIAEQQEQHQIEGSAQVPPPSIVNWTEKRMLKLIQEKRDQANLTTFVYTKNMDGKYTFVCESFGFGLPYDTRSNNPEHYQWVSTKTGPQWGSSRNCNITDNNGNCINGEFHLMPQPEPNGLHIPASAKGTWNLCKNPETGKPTVSYQEEDIAVFEYRLPPEMVEGFHPAPIPQSKQVDQHAIDVGRSGKR